jgi:hypothetical protein
MAVAIDAVSPGATAATNTGAASLTWTHTVGTGSNQALYVAIIIGFSPADTAHTVSTVTYNGVAMKSVGKVKSDNQEWGWVEVFRMLAPPQGAHTVAVSVPISVHTLIGGGISLNNVDQTTPNGPIGTNNFGNGATATCTAISSATGNLVIAASSGGSGFSSTTGTKAFSANVDTAGGAGNGYCATYAGSATVTPSFTLTADWWGVVAFNVNATGAVVAVPISEQTPPSGMVCTFSSNWGAGSTDTLAPVNVPDGAVIAVVSGANASVDPSVILITDVGGHTWTRLTGSYNPSSNPLCVDYWFNNTGGAIDILPQVKLTYTNNKTVALGVYLILGSSGTPSLVTSVTGATQTPKATGTPTVNGSLMCLHYIQRLATALPSSYVTGSAADTAGVAIGGSGADAMGAGTIYQTAVNAQTTSPVTVGANAPSFATWAALVEYKPAGGTTWAGAATMAATSGLSAGPIAKYAAAAVMAATSALTAGANATLQATATLPAQSGLTIAGSLTAAAAVTLPATSGFTATAAPIALAATLPANSGLTAAAMLTGPIAATLPATSGLSAVPAPVAAAATLPGTSGFTATAGPIALAATLPANSTLTAAAALTGPIAATLPATSGLAAMAGAVAGAALLPATSGLTAVATANLQAAATLPAASSLAANAILLAAAAAVLPATSGLGADVVPPGANATLPAVSGFSATAAPAALAVTLTAISGLSATAAGGTVGAAVLAATSSTTAIAQVAVQVVTVLPGTSSLTAAALVAYAAAAVLAGGSGFTATASAAGTTTPYVPGPVVSPRDTGITHPRDQGVTSPR